MNITLTEHDAEVLRGLLRDYLPSLQREVARTEQRELRHLMVERLDVLERFIEQLSRETA
ncbi:MAG: hypothetical protein KJ066_12275 [Acidobacteria bacterium]|jgi:hypothetical protein|nr:hypothetical protein [Acidobacteriota bacterium]